jgi:hypothetical protein
MTSSCASSLLSLVICTLLQPAKQPKSCQHEAGAYGLSSFSMHNAAYAHSCLHLLSHRFVPQYLAYRRTADLKSESFRQASGLLRFVIAKLLMRDTYCLAPTAEPVPPLN